MKTTTRLAGPHRLFARNLVTLAFTVACALPCATSLAQIQFSDATSAWGIDNGGRSFGAAVGDYNNDGHPDIWIGNHGGMPTLYVNQAGAGFVDIIDDVLFAGTPDSHGAAWADVDRDGDLDLVEMVGGGAANQLMTNINGLLFDQGDAYYGVGYFGSRGRSPLWLDYDRDGFIDLLLGHVLGNGSFPMLARNTGAGFVAADSSVGIGEVNVLHAQLANLTDDFIPEIVYHSFGAYPSFVFDPRLSVFINVLNQLNIPPQPAPPNVNDALLADLNGDLLTDMVIAKDRGALGIDQTGNRISVAYGGNNDEQIVAFRSAGDLFPNVAVTGLSTLEQRVYIGSSGVALDEVPPVLVAQDETNWGLASYQPGIDTGLYIGYDPARETWTFALSTGSGLLINAIIDSNAPVTDLQTSGFEAVAQPSPPGLLLRGPGGFVDAAAGSGLDIDIKCKSVVGGDFDNDMDLDVFFACTGPVSNHPNQLFRNDGDGQFSVVAGAGGAAGTNLGRSDTVVSADFNGDGCLDLYVTNGEGGVPFNDGPNELFLCTPNANNWLQIDLRGRISNTDAIGATVIITTAGQQQIRLQGGGTHRYAQNHSRLHYGLGTHTGVDTVRVIWPSGLENTLTNVAANQILSVLETTDAQCGDGIDNDDDGRIDFPDDTGCTDYFDNFEAPTADDSDSDGIADALDNCSAVSNQNQRDTDGDGFGNVCDADLNNDCAINVLDLGLFRLRFFTTDADADLDGNGVVNALDLGRLRASFFSAPGPSGLNTSCL